MDIATIQLYNTLTSHAESGLWGWAASTAAMYLSRRNGAEPAPYHMRALVNISKHVRAQQVKINLVKENGHLSMTILYNVAGFDANAEYPDHLGMHTMRERAEKVGGIFAIDSPPNSGTRIQIIIPR